ncbi:hypothetical protein Tco_0762554 [Tanacetum coccineum]
MNKLSFEVSDDELEAPEDASQSPGHAPPSSDNVSGPEHPPSPDYVPGPEEPEQALLLPEYVHELVYPKYLAPSDDDIPVEYQPLPANASPTALSPGYIADSNPKEDPKEDPDDNPKEDHADYLADGGDEEKEESSEDDADDEDEEEASEEEDHLALADSSDVPIDDHVPSTEDTEVFETDESAPTPPSPRPRRARISVTLEPPMAASMKARIAEYTTTPTPPSPPPSPLSPLSSPLP